MTVTASTTCGWCFGENGRHADDCLVYDPELQTAVGGGECYGRSDITLRGVEAGCRDCEWMGQWYEMDGYQMGALVCPDCGSQNVTRVVK